MRVQIKTNRDLYIFFTELSKRFSETEICLRDYLRALWELGKEYSHLPRINADQLAALLEKAFSYQPEAALPDSYCDEIAGKSDAGTFSKWENTILCQIICLEKLESAGAFNNELRYFGVDLDKIRCGSCKYKIYPTWFNFDPFTFIECGISGTFGGWISEDGYQDKVIKLEMINWHDFTKFLKCGQCYE